MYKRQTNVSVNGFEVVRSDVADVLTLAGSPPSVQTSAGHDVVPGGSIGSLLVETRSLADQVGADLDALALELRDLVNTAHGAGVDLAGNAGGDVFSGTGAHDLAVAATLTASGLAASATGEANDGNHALTLAGLRSAAGANGTVADQMLAVTGKVGAARASAVARADLTETMLDDVRAARGAVSGVNIDEELTLLLQYQRSYEAAARVLTAVDEMLDVLVNRTGLVGR